MEFRRVLFRSPARSTSRRVWLFGHSPRALPSEHLLPFLTMTHFSYRYLAPSLVLPPGCVCLKHHLHLVPHPPKHRQLLLLRPGGMGRIIKTPMITVHLAWKHRTRLVGVAANRDHGFNGFLKKLAQGLRAMPGNIYADFLHHSNGQRMHVARRFRPGALHLDQITRRCAQDAFRSAEHT